MVEVLPSPSVLLQGMTGSQLMIAVAHGEGQVQGGDVDRLVANQQAALRYVDNYGQPAEHYPANPNGSVGGLNGFTSADGRVTIMMPHPERVTRACSIHGRRATGVVTHLGHVCSITHACSSNSRL